MDLLPTNDFVGSYIDHSKNIYSLLYRYSKCWHISVHNIKKITFINITLKWQAHFVHFGGNVCQIPPVWITRVWLSIIHSGRYGVPLKKKKKKQLVQFATQTINSTSAFPWDKHYTACSKNTSCILPSLHRILNICMLKGMRLNNVNHFYYFIDNSSK